MFALCALLNYPRYCNMACDSSIKKSILSCEIYNRFNQAGTHPDFKQFFFRFNLLGRKSVRERKPNNFRPTLLFIDFALKKE